MTSCNEGLVFYSRGTSRVFERERGSEKEGVMNHPNLRDVICEWTLSRVKNRVLEECKRRVFLQKMWIWIFG